MAQKVNILLVDDLDGSEATETIAFGLDGTDYEIDLNDKNAENLRSALAEYVAHARKVTGGRGKSRRASSSSSPSVDKSAVREWAKANGYDVSERGRIPAEVQEAYDAAQKAGTKTESKGSGRGGRRRSATVDESGTTVKSAS